EVAMRQRSFVIRKDFVFRKEDRIGQSFWFVSQFAVTVNVEIVVDGAVGGCVFESLVGRIRREDVHPTDLENLERRCQRRVALTVAVISRSEEHTSELQS